ncbi:MAG TPA: VWA domain-containing protein [Pirellulaceae bacterium]|nr:VWA domain-containing protein [Pirellulaceae bacterium]
MMAALAQSTGVFYQLARLQTLTEWWHWLVLAAVCLGVAIYVGIMYRRDSVELPRGLAAALLALRLAAFVGILFFFFGLEKRAERELVKNSRVLLVVDTSQSMALRDSDAGAGTAVPSRMDQLVVELEQNTWLESLRQKHDVVVYRFDEAEAPLEVASLPKLPDDKDAKAQSVSPQAELAKGLAEARGIATVAAGLLGVSLLAGVIYLLWGRVNVGGEQSSWSLLVSIVALIAGLVVLAVANLRHPDIGLLAIAGIREARLADEQESGVRDQESEEKQEQDEIVVKWNEALLPRGAQTRIGDNLKYLVDKERGGPIAGIVLITDGRQTGGLDYEVAAEVAAEAMIPVYAVGMGSDHVQPNLKVVDVEAPQRVHPGNKFTLTGFVQALGTNRTSVTVELYAGDANGQGEIKEDELVVNVGTAGEAVPVKFELTPEEQGIRQYRVRVQPIDGEIEKNDNEKTAKVEVIDKKTKVMLLAGGPHRDYIFLRNQLFRDKEETTVDVLLQSAQPGSSQDADEVLLKFPEVADELFEYDCIVAFDPDWEALDENQVELLERWVAEKAGGLIVVAGPVHTPYWSSRPRGDARLDRIKALYPVAFYYQGSATLSLGRFGGDKPWPLNFTPDGETAEFLWLDDDADSSQRVRDEFAGVYGYYAVKDPKPGARIYARFSDPETKIDGELPIYMAGHFYGSGRVFFLASCEMWRIRELDDRYFETFYTKLIRWAAEGRILRDSSRGVLLVDKDRAVVGDQVAVRAILQDAQHRPLSQSNVTAVLVQPDRTRAELVLPAVKDAARAGTYAQQFTILQEGDYSIQLQHPDSPEQVLEREVRSQIPKLETQRPERNDQLLQTIAKRTGGTYYVGMNAAISRSTAGGGSASGGRQPPDDSSTRTTASGGSRPPLAHAGSGQPGLVNLLTPRDQITVLPGTPDRTFERLLMTWLMGLICGVLCLEWLIRRLSKLA